MVPHPLVQGVHLGVVGTTLVRMLPERRPAMIGIEADVFPFLEPDGGEIGFRLGRVFHIRGKGGIGGKAHDGGVHAILLGQFQGNGIAEIDESGLGKGILLRDAIQAIRDAIHAKGAPRHLLEAQRLLPAQGRRAGIMDKDIGLAESRFQLRIGGETLLVHFSHDDFQVGEALLEHRHLLLGKKAVPGPEDDFGFRDEFLRQGEETGGMGDVAHIFRLPAGTQENHRLLLRAGNQQDGE